MEPSGRQRLLIVDDDRDARESLQMILQAASYEVEVAANGSQAFNRQRARPADAVITDIFMPITDGIETIRQIRAEFPRTKIVVISGGAKNLRSEKYLDIALDAGADIALPKPFSVEDLLGILKGLLPGPG